MKDRMWRGLAFAERAWKGRAGDGEPGATSCFLVMQHAMALGTVIHTLPLIAALREAIPKCRIIVAASGASVQLYRNHEQVESVVVTPSPTKDLKGSVAALRKAKVFEGQEFCTLTPQGNERSKIALQSVFGGSSSMRVGFTVVPELYRIPLRFDPALSQIANNLSIVRALGHPVHHHEPRIYFDESDVAFARELLRSTGATKGQPVAIFVTQTYTAQRKSWRAERFREAARFLWENFGAYVVWVGTAAESAAIDRMREGLAFPTANVAGKTTLLQLAALLSLGSVGLTLDTGSMHVGRAVGLPMVIIAPAWSPPLEWLPLGNPRFRILKNREMPVPPPDDYIIDEVSVDEVKAALSDLLRTYPPL